MKGISSDLAGRYLKWHSAMLSLMASQLLKTYIAMALAHLLYGFILTMVERVDYY